MSSSMLFETMATANEKKIGIATLNSPQKLNGLSLEMSELMLAQLMKWQRDPAIAVVVLKGAGEKAFCAGGDLQALYKTLQENQGGDPWENRYARNFFDVEYRLDYLIHTFEKPILCWGSGIVMGGGVGLMMGASHRVVSETTRFAMPEISIGLFPDVGGTRMLSHLPGGIGLFLGLTGAQLGAGDCRYLGLADYMLETARWPAAMQAIQAQPWSDSRPDNDIRLHKILFGLQPQSPLPPGALQKNYTLIKELCDGPDFSSICASILALATSDDPWLARAAATFQTGSPGSARLTFALLDKVRHLSLAQVFQQEYIVSLQCCVQGDFQEGIRALLIDKDKTPNWNPATLSGATQDWVQRFFEPAWPLGTLHPLADLGCTQAEQTIAVLREPQRNLVY